MSETGRASGAVRRTRLIFVTAVFTALLTGILLERSGSRNPALRFAYSQPRHVPFEELAPPVGTEVLEGSVLRPDRSAAPGVAVHVSRLDVEPGVAEPLHAVFTAKDGSFRVEGLVEGSYEVVLVEPGYPISHYPVPVPARGPLELSLDPPVGPLASLPALVRSTLDGRLMPPVGFTVEDTPLDQYEVVLEPAPDVSPLTGAIARTLPVDPEGFFRVDDLAEADYVVRVLPLWASGGTWPVLDETVFSHGAAAGGNLSLTLRLRSGGIQGSVLDVAGDPLRGALVEVSPVADETRIWPPTQTNESGFFEVQDLVPGDYEVRIRAGGARKRKGVHVATGERPFVRFTDVDPRVD